jgi:glycosyltransferase involved in cell wall biosynthesis
MKTKVLFLPDWYPLAANQISGIFVQEHARAAQLYDDVAVLHAVTLSRSEQTPFFWGSLEASIPTFRFRIPEPKIPRTGILLYILAVIKAFRLLKRKWGTPHVIHAHEPLSALMAYILHKLYGIPYVVSEHSTSFPLRTISQIEVQYARLAFRHASRVFGPNKNFSQDLKFYSIDCDFRWLPNCFDPKIFFPPQPNFRKPLVLHCSLFDKKKRVPDFIKAFALCQQEIPEAQIELFGDGEERKVAESLANDLLTPGSFIFHGLQPKWRIAESMRKAMVFVLPSTMETFGCVLVEAMACGTPVISTNVGGLPYIISSEQGILIEPGDINNLGKFIKSVLSGETTFDENGISKYATNNFSREVIGQILHKEYIRAAMHGYRPHKSFQQSNRVVLGKSA